MSPPRFQDSEVISKGVMINGPRPSQLKIKNPNHSFVQKHSTKRQPVIIYTHSPKIIHAQARDFMALVQKLTGLSRSEDEKTAASESEGSLSEETKDCGGKNIVYEDSESSSVLTDDKFVSKAKHDFSTVWPMYEVRNNPYVVDAPLFAPRTLFQSTNTCSPAYMDFMNWFPDC